MFAILRARCATFILLALAGLLFASNPAGAGEPVHPRVEPILPYRGMYYEPARGGTGLTVDVDRNGAVFAVFYTYDDAGSPYYYIMQGDYVAETDPAKLMAGAPVGTMQTKAYYTTNGECLGPQCEYRRAEAHATDIPAAITWTTATTAHLEIGTQAWDVVGGKITVDTDQFLLGSWTRSVAMYKANNRKGERGLLYGASERIFEKSALTAADFDDTCAISLLPQEHVSVPGNVDLYKVLMADGSHAGPFFYVDPVDGSLQSFYAVYCDNGWSLPYGHSTAVSITGPSSFRYIAAFLYWDTPESYHLEYADFRFVRTPPGVDVYVPE